MSLANVTITGNIASDDGGGLYCYLSNPILDNVAIANNEGDKGGGIYCYGFSPSLQNVTISDNLCNHGGGGLYCYLTNPILDNVVIVNNSASSNYGGDGGGIYCMESNPSLQNVTISGNSASSSGGDGGGIYCNESSPSLQNVTISDNSASSTNGFGGGIYCYNSNPILVNCIMWNDSPWEEICIESGSVTATYSDIEDGWAGIGNIDSDPEFIDPANGNYNLSETSPCIDAGDPSSPLDPDGTTADMGAWFYNQGSAIEDNEIENVKFNLSNYPNPFNPLTTIKFDIKENEIGGIKIFNIKGQLLESHQFEAGEHDFQWDASSMSSGVYLYQFQTENSTVSKKMLLLK